MHILNAKREAKRLIKAGNAPLLQSGSGMGKSSIILQLFDEYAAQHAPGEVGLGITFAATVSPIDMIGVPFKGEHTFKLPDGTDKKITVTDPTVPLWMISTEGKPAFCYRKFFWVCEEYGQGSEDSKRGFSEVFLSGGTSYWRGARGLPEGSVRIAATNKGARYGVTRDFDFAVARRTLINIEPDVDITVAHWDKPYMYQGKVWQVSPFMKAWAKRNGHVLAEEEPKEQGPWCNPRSACAVDRYMQIVMEENNGAVPHADADQMAGITETLQGTWGANATQSYMQDLQFLQQLPSYQDVVNDPAGTPVPTKADLLLLMVYELAGRSQPDDMPQVIQYVSRIGQKAKDMEVTYVQALLRRDYKTMMAVPAMKAWTAKNANLVNVIGALMV